ncbi:MAG: type II toxin-antitoxin system HipA family toxin [Gemmatimonadetes bacterium]|nr:type II toxin-antitoxin system HipA family toxin [Gemmatimonadota bacterium]
MTSKSCYVYIQLPSSLIFETCGHYRLDELDDGTRLGRFVYGRTYLDRQDAVPLDPFNLPLTPREFQTVRLGGLFGALRDVTPDAWGRRVIERRAETSDLKEFDYLVHDSDGRIGALSFGAAVKHQASPRPSLPEVRELKELREAAGRVEADLPLDEDLEDLLQPGSSLGGARPKTVVRDQAGTLWLAKFPAKEDRWSNAAVEGGMLRLAERCGIDTPETRLEELGDEQVLLVKRFDRDLEPDGGGEYRHRMVSALTVLDLDDSVTDRSGWSYLDLADEIQRWSDDPLRDKRELFRRIAFNGLISNLDDHPRNHALLAPDRRWRLSPAYDLTPSPVRSLERRDLAMTVGHYGRIASRYNLLSSAPRFGLSREEASATIDGMIGVVEKGWRSSILDHGGSELDCEAVKRAFLYEGFEYAAPT